MKTYQLKPSAVAPKAAIIERMPSLLRRLSVLEKLHPEHTARVPVCVGADLEKAGACLVIQIGAESVSGTITLGRAEVVLLCNELLARGWRVATGVEACGFGWVFQAQLRRAGAEVFTFATESLTGRRKTNQRDAAALARMVAGRVVHGDTQSGRTVREPSPEEQKRRFLTRHRAQLVGHRGRIEAQGRGLIYDSGIEAAPECWWGRKTWPRFADLLARSGNKWLRDVLEKMREHALFVHDQILAFDEQIAALAPPAEHQPHGLGDLTAAMLQGEVMDWSRFKNRKQAGRLPAPAGAALRAKAPPFGYLAPLDSSAARPANTAPAKGKSSATSTGSATAASAAPSSKPSGECSDGTRHGAASQNTATSYETNAAAPCGKRKPASPA